MNEKEFKLFDMFQCKFGDKLKNRDGTMVVYGVYYDEDKEHSILNEDGTFSYVDDQGLDVYEYTSPNDIIGFWEE